jgi:hypothetical protein
MFRNTKSNSKFGQKGAVVLVIPMPGKKGSECHSGLHPSGKELLQRCSVTKIPLHKPIVVLFFDY